MLDKIDLKKILFLDIETVPEKEHFDELSSYRKELDDLLRKEVVPKRPYVTSRFDR